jgi:cell division GTPase FtsZ
MELLHPLTRLHFDRFHKDIKIEDLFSSAFQEYQELNANYDEVLIIHNNNLSTLVPTLLMRTTWEVTCNIILKSLKLIFLLLIH